MARRPTPPLSFDADLAALPPALRWREWMGRVEAVIFAAAEPVSREVLARVVGPACNLDLLIDDIRAELKGRPYELVAVAGGWQHRTRKGFAEAIRVATGQGGRDPRPLSNADALVLMGIACLQPITRGELGRFFGREVSRDTVGHLRRLGFIAAGPRAPQPGAPHTYVTTKAFLTHYGLDTLRDLPDLEALEDAGLLGTDRLLAGDIPPGLPVGEGDDEADRDGLDEGDEDG
ncbi:SMC-Scp complex subunit ScpB [Ancylobacter terrae]|uniref:SMC-Scp complex subunit ScpB n=1 Tax=Ancylobacter sp. sgz301288 TaxID=3342077 RepID=UPI0038591FBB